MGNYLNKKTECRKNGRRGSDLYCLIKNDKNLKEKKNSKSHFVDKFLKKKLIIKK